MSKFNTLSRALNSSLPVQYNDVTVNPTRRTSAVLKIVISPYPSSQAWSSNPRGRACGSNGKGSGGGGDI